MLAATFALRTLVVLLVLVIGLRLLGKRQIGQMTIYDLAMIMLVANSVQNAMTAGKGNLIVGFASAGTLFVFGMVMTLLFVRIPRLESVVAGTPTVLVSNGRVMERHMRREHVSMNQLLAAVREHEVGTIAEVKLAVLEINGDISIVANDQDAL